MGIFVILYQVEIMSLFDSINVKDYTYTLPANYIANYPAEKRGDSSLLIYRDGIVTDEKFKNIGAYLNTDDLLVFNKTKVVQARLLFRKESGAGIEVFCLEPLRPVSELSEAFLCKKKVVWKCLIGGLKKWKSGKLFIKRNNLVLCAERTGFTDNAFEVTFSWEGDDLSFGEVLEIFGHIPLPPYIKRDSEEIDSIRYQTVFASEKGSVAAPTAALHFTDALIDEVVNTRKCKTAYLTLHVGAGTFKPIDTSVENHVMHTEQLLVDLETIARIRQNVQKNSVIAVGTTSLRTLESMYWLGVNIHEGLINPMHVTQFKPYEKESRLSATDALSALEDYISRNTSECLKASTGLMILPGYDFKIANKLITNFHQPGSTLLLLVAAFIGEEWKNVYQHALENNYRFLSYGDACFFSLKK